MKHRLTYPLTSPSALNPDARVLYSTRTDYDGRLYWGDPFATAEETKVDTREQREVYRPTERFLAAADELEAHRLGSYDRELEQLHRTRVHPLYTVARGSGMYFASVSLVRTDHVRSQYPSHVHRPSVHDELLLGTFIGADFNYRGTDGGWAVWCLEVGHATATDLHHERARVGVMIVANPVITESRDGVQSCAGTLTDARLYPPGTDPLTVADSSSGFPSMVCNEEDEPHQFALHLPPERDALAALIPSLVTVSMYPLCSYEAA